MNYPHRWTCTRAAAGAQDPDTGAWTPGAAATVYDGPADCQDEGATIQMDQGGRSTAMSEAVLYLADESAAASHNVGDVGTVTWEDGSTDDAEVVKITRLDGKLHLGWL